MEHCWALLDVEYIQTTIDHRCIRKLYILAENGYIDLELDFFPCKRYEEIDWKYQRSFSYCQKHIHKLGYNPKKKNSPNCLQVLPLLNEFIVDNGIELILFKGGTIEKDLCTALDMPSLNIENFEGLQKANSHNPRTEVICYFHQIVKIL